MSLKQMGKHFADCMDLSFPFSAILTFSGGIEVPIDTHFQELPLHCGVIKFSKSFHGLSLSTDEVGSIVTMDASHWTTYLYEVSQGIHKTASLQACSDFQMNCSARHIGKQDAI